MTNCPYADTLPSMDTHSREALQRAQRVLELSVLSSRTVDDDQPQGELLLALGRMLIAALAAIGAAAAAGFAVFDDGAAAVLTSTFVAEAQQRKEITPQDQRRIFDMPLRHDATVTQSGQGITEPRTRYYFRPENR